MYTADTTAQSLCGLGHKEAHFRADPSPTTGTDLTTENYLCCSDTSEGPREDALEFTEQLNYSSEFTSLRALLWFKISVWLLILSSNEMLGKIEGRRARGKIEDEMVGWHHWLNGHEFEQTPADREGQGSLASYSPWGHKELDTT